MSELIQVKSTLEKLSSAFEEFKKANEAKLEAKATGKSTAELDEKIAKLNSAMNEAESKHAAFLKSEEEKSKKREEEYKDLEARLRREFEAKMGRAANPLGGGADEKKELEMKGRKAFEKLLRLGPDEFNRRAEDDEKKVLVISNDTTGGYLAPPTWLLEIIKAEVLYSPMRDICTLRRIGTQELLQPKRTGTAAATRAGETSTRVESQNPSWGLLRIQAPEMYAEARVSMQNLEDSAFDLEQLLTDEFSEQFGVKEGQETITGIGGSTQCLGILDANAAGAATPIAYTPSGSAATISGPDGSQADAIITLIHAVKTAYAANGRFIMNRSSLGKVRTLKDKNGQYLWMPSLVPTNPASIVGYPYTEMPDMPNEGTNTFPIAFGDFRRAYTLVERLEMAVVRDPYTVASTGQIKFTARRRIGGQVVLGEALRLLKCAVS